MSVNWNINGCVQLGMCNCVGHVCLSIERAYLMIVSVVLEFLVNKLLIISGVILLDHYSKHLKDSLQIMQTNLAGTAFLSFTLNNGADDIF